MEIVLAKNIGFCFGVRRAIDLVTKELEKNEGPVYTLGPLIHNPQVMEKLKKENLRCIHKIEEIKREDDLKKAKVFIRSHGIPHEILVKVRSKKVKIIDATCPSVKRIQHLVSDLARRNYTVIIFGKKNHPEVETLVSYAQGKAKVIENIQDLQNFVFPNRKKGVHLKIGLVSQTTQSTDDFQKIVAFFQLPLFQNKKVKIYNTLCPTTKKRQMEAEEIARHTDIVFVVGGKNSSNTTRLAEICVGYQKNTFHIETAEEIDAGTLKKGKIRKIGIITGASTPDWIVKEVVNRIKN